MSNFLVKLLVISVLLSCFSNYVHSNEIIGKESYYFVKKGDTLKKISTRYGVSHNQIIQTNTLKNPDRINPGQKLLISSKKIIPKKAYNGLIINLPEFLIYNFEDGMLIDTYPIAIGKKSWQTPRGRFFIDNKALNPAWRIPPNMSKKLKYRKKIVPPGPKNPLGKYWLGLSIAHIGIHSTNQPNSIGQSRSHGCMRLYPSDAEELFETVEIGTQGEIIYEPVKIGSKNNQIYLEVHHDIYNLKKDLYLHTLKLLKQKNLYEYVDTETVKNVVDSKQGVPINITKTHNQNFYYALRNHLKNSKLKAKSTMLWSTLDLD